MEHLATEGSWRAYQALPPEIRNRADKQFALLKSNPQYPSLLLKKVGDSRGQEVWSAQVTLNYRALALKRRPAQREISLLPDFVAAAF